MTALLTAAAPTPTADAIFLRPTASANWTAFVMDRTFTQFVGERKTTKGHLPAVRVLGKSLDMTDESAQFAEFAARMKRLREVFSNDIQATWAERHGFTPSQWGNFEAGTRRMKVDDAERLCNLYGLTLDWIYRGRRDGLSENASKVL